MYWVRNFLSSKLANSSVSCLMHIAWSSSYATFMLNIVCPDDKFQASSVKKNLVKDAVDLPPFE